MIDCADHCLEMMMLQQVVRALSFWEASKLQAKHETKFTATHSLHFSTYCNAPKSCYCFTYCNATVPAIVTLLPMFKQSKIVAKTDTFDVDEGS